MSIFETASRNKTRFPSIKGFLVVEQLWDLPLTSKIGFDLDSVAKITNAQLKDVTEESFVQVKVNPQKSELQLALDIVKHIIAVKQTEAEVASTRAANKAEREKLLGILEQKQNTELQGLSKEEIEARIKALG